MNPIAIVLIIVGIVVLLVADGYILYKLGEKHRIKFAEAEIGSAEKEAERIRASAAKDAETTKKAMLVEAKDEVLKTKDRTEKECNRLKTEAEREARERRKEISALEKRILTKEEAADKRAEKLEKAEEAIGKRTKQSEVLFEKAEAAVKKQQDELTRISAFTVEEAKEHLLNMLDGELDKEKAAKISAYEIQLKEETDDRARNLIAGAVTRLASEVTSELTVSVVTIPGDDMKGRIIGREGRNIRTIEQLTGVSLIVDDTPETITLSCHDKVRREVARLSLEWLIQDGRINPTRIDEYVERAKREIEQRVKQAGERALIEVGVSGINHELVKILGRLHYRTSFSQNVLTHSIEVAHLAGLMASELGIDPTISKRAGLLHDVGKALSQDAEGSHVHIGVEICRKYKENAEILHAVEAHHGDIVPTTISAALVQAADTISAARPGARSENYENYVKRLQKLEEICSSYHGVDKAFAIQAGREVRIMIKPEVVNDEGMTVLARTIAGRIEKDMDYPGTVRVTLLRESRAVEFAK